MPILVATSDEQFLRQASGYMKNVEAFLLPPSSGEGGFEAPLRSALALAVESGVIGGGDLVAVDGADRRDVEVDARREVVRAARAQRLRVVRPVDPPDGRRVATQLERGNRWLFRRSLRTSFRRRRHGLRVSSCSPGIEFWRGWTG